MARPEICFTGACLHVSAANVDLTRANRTPARMCIRIVRFEWQDQPGVPSRAKKGRFFNKQMAQTEDKKRSREYSPANE